MVKKEDNNDQVVDLTGVQDHYKFVWSVEVGLRVAEPELIAPLLCSVLLQVGPTNKHNHNNKEWYDKYMHYCSKTKSINYDLSFSW